MEEAIYLDHAAATPLHPDVLAAMLPWMSEDFGNPSSLHRFGQKARSAVTASRDRIAALLQTNARGVLFTSGGTESDNLALFGTSTASPDKRHLITTAIEHHAVLHACDQLEKLGWDVTHVPVGPTGRLQTEAVEKAIRPDTVLISVMYANNEVGTVQPLAEIAQLTRERDVLLHSDAVQAVGKLPIHFTDSGIDLMSVSAHKMGGPKGVGALICSQRALARLVPQQYGGVQERGRRAGTENVPGIVGFAKALQLATDSMDSTRTRFEECRRTMLQTFAERLPEGSFMVNGDAVHRLPAILNVSFPELSTEMLLMNLDLAGIAAASGSACTSGSHEPSHVLKAMQLPDTILSSAVRFSFGSGQTAEEIRVAAENIATVVLRLRTIK